MNLYSFLRPLVLGVLFGLFFAAGSLAFDCDLHKQAGTTTVDSGQAVIDGMILANDCWTGEAPADMAGQFPGHVVVTVDGVPRVGGTPMVSKALGQVFDGEDHGLTVHAFCR